jgi:hypothetical protein
MRISIIQTIGWAVDDGLRKADQHRAGDIKDWGPEQIRGGFSLSLVAITRCDEDGGG